MLLLKYYIVLLLLTCKTVLRNKNANKFLQLLSKFFMSKHLLKKGLQLVCYDNVIINEVVTTAFKHTYK